ncbi:Sec1-like protein [Dichomitus squalens LYAD-421 SS1]|uniref:Sec1-like protein n=1 Tax=Dichomitus squalens (strain LYAD-421) TaxID=732165 RepID=UPI0004415985|nr:Sec1-like protein [Dichomitus squalens LYAD-421 SS1]EJF67229.1 Sec1-like protein [Dichomitus squalens LYAD-421 SS1]
MASSSVPSSEVAASKTDSGSEGQLDVSVLRELARKALVDSLNSVNGAKTLVLDPTLAGPLGLVTEVAVLKHHGVDKMFWLEPGALSATSTNIVYLCRPFIKWIKIIADQVKRHARENQKHTYTIFLVPRTSTLVTRILEEEGVLGDVTVSSYNLQFIPIADDVISLENDNAFKEIWVDGDETVIYDSMQALLTLEKLHGAFPRIIGKGDYAARLANLLTRNTPQAAAAAPADTHLSAPSDTIDSLIVLDRRVDMISPLLTQLTYEGLIDELIGLKNSHVEVSVSLVSPPPASNQPNASAAPNAASTSTATATSLTREKKRKHHLTTATDPLLAELRDLNFSAVGKKLNQVARRLDDDYKLRHQAMTVAQLKDFVGRLGGLQNEHQSLRLHTGLSEMLVPMTRTEEFNKSLEIQQNLLALYEVNAQIAAIEDLIAQGADMRTVVRLLCLASVVTGGVKAKLLENIKREILQTYGYNYLPLLLSLAAPPLSVLLPNPLPHNAPPSVADSKYPYANLRKSLRLLVEDPDPMEELENDISYVYSGFAPISVRLVQCVAQKGGVLSNPAAEKEKGADKKGSGADGDSASRRGGTAGTPLVQAHPIVGWKGFEDVIASIPGETVDIVQKLPGGQDGGAFPPVLSLMLPRERPTTTVVFFLGGCTYTEIAALRWVGRQNKGRKFLIATTGIINGNTMIDSIAGTASATSKEVGL